MNYYQKIRGLKTIPEFSDSIKKIVCWEENNTNAKLEPREASFLLSSSLVFLRNYDVDKRFKSYAEFAYYIILKYALISDDYRPLFDFSVNFGFYPISKSLIDSNDFDIDTIQEASINAQIDDLFSHNNITETYEQRETRKVILTTEAREISYVAPTSYGKSSIILEDIRNNLNNRNFIGVIVPTKSLLAQTYKLLKNDNLGRKILIHDEMYEGEKKFIAVLTQERALRLLNKNENLFFDILYIDEAHNLFNKDLRNILLSRLIRLNKIRNENQKVVYLSPLISDSDNLKTNINQDISEQRIDFNMKEPEIYEYRMDFKYYKYNRFFDDFYELGSVNTFIDYMCNNFSNKNFIYLSAPKKIENFSKVLFEQLPYIEEEMLTEIEEVVENLRNYVHEDFYEIDYLKKGILYLHAKLPDNVKEYLEYKFSKTKSIKYLVANNVILEGINLPIDSLFVMSVYKRTTKDLVNLIGRVNRLNLIFVSGENNIRRLLPKVHFVNTIYNRKNSKMSNAIRKLRSGEFDDVLNNPLLVEFDIESIEDINKKNSLNKIIEEEHFVLSEPENEIKKLEKKMLELGMKNIYILNEFLCHSILQRIVSRKGNVIDSIGVIQLIQEIFVTGLENSINDDEFRRLKYGATVSYYENFINTTKALSLKDNINNLVGYFSKKSQSLNPKLFIGPSFGEESFDGINGRPVYVNLQNKNTKQLANLAIVKLKLENDFVNYKLIMFFQLLLDYELITKEKYNLLVYGTNNNVKLGLLKLGLTINIVNRLETDNQIDNIIIDENNIVISNEDFENYKNSLDDFFRFELNKFL